MKDAVVYGAIDTTDVEPHQLEELRQSREEGEAQPTGRRGMWSAAALVGAMGVVGWLASGAATPAATPAADLSSPQGQGLSPVGKSSSTDAHWQYKKPIDWEWESTFEGATYGAPGSEATSNSTSFRATLNLLSDDRVVDFVRAQTGVHNLRTLSDEVLYSLVPSKIVVEGDTELMKGEAGDDADDGFITFCIQCRDCDPFGSASSRNGSSFVIVMTPKGDLVQIYSHNDTSGYDVVRPHPYKSEHTFMSKNINQAEKGPIAEWDWGDGGDRKAVDPVVIAKGGDDGMVSANAHDLRWSEAFVHGMWVMNGTSEHFITLVNVTNGEAIAYTHIEDSAALEVFQGDTNHYTFFSNDTEVISGSRYGNSFSHWTLPLLPSTITSDTRTVETYNASLDYTVGGEFGDWTLVDVDGSSYVPNSTEYDDLLNGTMSLWAGQHSTEYYGDNLVMMFDNGYNPAHDGGQNPLQVGYTRMLAIRLDSDAETATIEWAHNLGYNSTIFGDADKLPSTNVLGCGWPNGGVLNDGSIASFDAEILEVTEDHEDAWNMKITGNPLARYNHSLTHSDKNEIWGWTIYSVERFYGSPLVTSVSCSSEGELTFSTYSSFKMAFDYPGYYKVTKDSGSTVVESTGFGFSAYQRKLEMEVTFSSDDCTDSDHPCVLEVSNELDQKTTKDFVCS